MRMRVIDLFSGIGGFSLGFERAGFQIVAHVEKDAHCRKLLDARWPDAVSLDDVATAGRHNLPDCDVVTFGFPCQDLSVAGKRGGLAGKRSGLFYEATRIIDELRPAHCLFENVPGLLSSENGRDFTLVLMEMDRIGYHGAWRMLDAQWFRVAQRRRRVFGLFSRLDSGAERCAEILSLPESLRGHPPPSRETGESVAIGVTERTRSGGRNLETIDDVAYALTNPGEGGRSQSRMIGVPAVVGALACNTGPNGHDAGNFASNQAVDSGYLIPAVAATLRSASDSPASHGKTNGTDRMTLVPVAFQQNHRDEVRLINGDGAIAGALAAEAGMKQQNYVGVPVAFQGKASSTQPMNPGPIAPTLDVSKSGGTCVAFTTEQTPKFNNDCALTLTKQSPTGGGQPQAVAFDSKDGTLGENGVTSTLTTNGDNNHAGGRLAVSIPTEQTYKVRRLSPRECERLQAFQWRCAQTDPGAWQDELGRWWSPDYTAGFSDSTRYKMLGNAVCVNVVEWIARRIATDITL